MLYASGYNENGTGFETHSLWSRTHEKRDVYRTAKNMQEFFIIRMTLPRAPFPNRKLAKVPKPYVM